LLGNVTTVRRMQDQATEVILKKMADKTGGITALPFLKSLSESLM